jgi:hypothetical protein
MPAPPQECYVISKIEQRQMADMALKSLWRSSRQMPDRGRKAEKVVSD